MKTDAEIQKDVLEELAWQPNIDQTQIGVAVENGVVTLTGVVDTYTKKAAAEKAVKRVSGVKAIAEDIEVKYGDQYRKTDKEIAKAVVNALMWNTSVPEEKITVKVENGTVHLSGSVEWAYQRDAARNATEHLLGVKYLVNNVTLKQEIEPIEIKNRITKAFERSAEIDAQNISVEAHGHTVKLRGKVHSLVEKDEARKAAYYAPGVEKVENELEVVY